MDFGGGEANSGEVVDGGGLNTEGEYEGEGAAMVAVWGGGLDTGLYE